MNIKINYSTVATSIVSAIIVGVVMYQLQKRTNGIVD